MQTGSALVRKHVLLTDELLSWLSAKASESSTRLSTVVRQELVAAKKRETVSTSKGGLETRKETLK